eukprot:m.105164 g.105164  ORF g.105164 m.105164 type:complete len:327 (+) comp27624_c1_seq1:80-1060(+)
MEKIIRHNLKPILCAIFNVVAVTGIVVANKKVFNEYHFHFPILLVLIHTVITYMGLRSAALFGLFEMKAMPVMPRVILAGSFVFYNCASLINLNYNTVGFYQISKILVTPTVMFINYFLYDEGTTTEVKLAVTVMLAGVTMATVTDVDVTKVGFLIGIGAVLGSGQSQLLIQKKQKELQASANQLLVAYTPFVMVMLSICTPIDKAISEHPDFTVTEWLQTYGTSDAIAMVIFSGFFGLLVSLSTFLMIGATSALTYNIVGHLKTVTILTVGVVYFGDSVNSKKLFGIMIALIGVIWYSKIKLDKQQAQQAAAAVNTPKSDSDSKV